MVRQETRTSTAAIVWLYIVNRALLATRQVDGAARHLGGASVRHEAVRHDSANESR